MERTETIRQTLSDNGAGRYIIHLASGRKMTRRIFLSDRDRICEFARRSKTKGYPVSTADWMSITPEWNTFDTGTLLHNARNTAKHLKASGLWTNIREDLERLLANDASSVLNLAEKMKRNPEEDWQEWNRNLNTAILQAGMKSVSIDLLHSLFRKGSVRTVRFGKYGEHRKRQLAEAIKEKKPYTASWKEGYDCSIEYNPECKDGQKKAWYSEEYSGCGNGHYFLLLDEKHVLFAEDD